MSLISLMKCMDGRILEKDIYVGWWSIRVIVSGFGHGRNYRSCSCSCMQGDLWKIVKYVMQRCLIKITPYVLKRQRRRKIGKSWTTTTCIWRWRIYPLFHRSFEELNNGSYLVFLTHIVYRSLRFYLWIYDACFLVYFTLYMLRIFYMFEYIPIFNRFCVILPHVPFVEVVLPFVMLLMVLQHNLAVYRVTFYRLNIVCHRYVQQGEYMFIRHCWVYENCVFF